MDKEGYYFLAPFITPEVLLRCDTDLIQKAKEGGLDVIQTYVFWNGHEPSPGKYYFEGNHDLVKFIKLVQQAGLYVHLRIGPYACAEWNFGGFPVWLKSIPLDDKNHNSLACISKQPCNITNIIPIQCQHTPISLTIHFQ